MPADAPKILIVDDEYTNVEFFNVMLTRLGYTVETAGGGDEAIEKILAMKPDLVLLDNILPDKTGWEVTRLVKQDPRFADVADTPIIMFSAMNEVEDKIEGFELGIEDYITKPYNFSEVLARIQSVLRHRELSKQVLRRERRLGLAESLNNSLVYFTTHVKEPLETLGRSADTVAVDDVAEVNAFIEQAKATSNEILATLRGLDDEVRDLKGRDAQLRLEDVSLEDLEEKYRKHAGAAMQAKVGSSR